MRILFVSHYYAPEVNAPATRTSEHCMRWAKQGHDVTVLTCNPNCPTGEIYEGHQNKFWPQTEMIDGVRVVRLWTYVAANSGKNRRIVNYLSFFVSVLLFGMFQKRPDVMIATSPQFFSGLAGTILGFLRRIPTVLEVRDVWPASIEAVGAMSSKPLLRALVGLERLMYWLPRHIVTVGPGYKKHIEERTNGTADVSIITNGVDLERLKLVPPNKAFLRQNQLEGKFVCSYVGTVGMAHGLDVVVRAAEILKQQQRDDIKFCIVGEGAMRDDIEAMVDERGVREFVSFAGLQPKSEIPNVLSSSDAVLVHLRGCELFSTVIPSKIFEIMAMQRPIIMGVKGAARDIVQEANAGVNMTPDSAEELAEIVVRLRDDNTLREQYCESGRRFVDAFYNRDSLAMDYLTLLHRVTGTKPNAPAEPSSDIPLTGASAKKSLVAVRD